MHRNEKPLPGSPSLLGGVTLDKSRAPFGSPSLFGPQAAESRTTPVTCAVHHRPGFRWLGAGTEKSNMER